MRDHRSTAADGPGAAGSGETLADLGEWELIHRLGAFAPPGQFADDAALVTLSGSSTEKPGLAGQPGGLAQGGSRQGEHTEAGAACGGSALVVNTDVLVEGIHFSDATTGPADVGWRAAAANLSDLAAMGCTEVVGLTVGLVAPASTPWSWVEGVYQGLQQALDTHGGVLLGGDCSGGSQRMLAVTALGRLPAPPASAGTVQAGEGPRTSAGTGPWGAIRRSDGRPGDALICTGPHGLSRLGLALLQGQLASQAGSCTAASHQEPTQGGATQASHPGWPEPNPASELPEALIQRAIAAHRRPVPRFDAVHALIGCRPAAESWRVGGCDSSDGLAAAVGAIAAASGCSARLNRRALPLDPAMEALPQAQAWCLGGGEDFELVLALEPAWAEALLEAVPGSTRIGELVTGAAGALGWSDGETWPGEGAEAGGYQHFH